MDIDHIDVKIYGPRNFPMGSVRIPATVVPAFGLLLTKAQAINPIYTPGLLLRWMVKLGHRHVQNGIANGAVETHPGGAEHIPGVVERKALAAQLAGPAGPPPVAPIIPPLQWVGVDWATGPDWSATV